MRAAAPYPVKVTEGGAELVHLLLADALGVPDQDLGLDLVDGAGDGGQQLLPAHPYVLFERRVQRSDEDTYSSMYFLLYPSKELLHRNKRC